MHGMNLATVECFEPAEQHTEAVTAIAAHRVARGSRVDHLLRCVSSGYLSGGCSCRSAIPASVVTAAWASELQRGDSREDRFFRFSWRGGVWLAFGLRDGHVRGVYCPEHSAARAERSSVQDLGVAS
jgi:hypothetical protein